MNTRPQDRAEALTSALFDHHVQVIELPLLALHACPLSDQLIELYSQLSQVDVIVVVSPTAVEIGMQYLKQLQIDPTVLAHIEWIAVGEKTAQALKQYHISSLVPQVETSEGMLSLPIFKQLNTFTKVAFWRGHGGRQFMMQQLQNDGIEVLNFVLYERKCPIQSRHKIHQIIPILQQQHYIVLVSSEASWLNWLELIQFDSSLLNKAQYWVLGERLFCILSDYKQRYDFNFEIIKLNSLSIESILEHVIQLQGKL